MFVSVCVRACGDTHTFVRICVSAVSVYSLCVGSFPLSLPVNHAWEEGGTGLEGFLKIQHSCSYSNNKPSNTRLADS